MCCLARRCDIVSIYSCAQNETNGKYCVNRLAMNCWCFTFFDNKNKKKLTDFTMCVIE